MNKLILPILLLLSVVCAQAKERTVTKPPFLVRNTNALEIDKIELTDTTAIFSFEAFSRPTNWLQISPDSYLMADGKKYSILSSEGIKLGEKFYTLASGKTSFKLTFPALPSSVASVDFIESDCDDCFKIWGIQLKGTQLPKLILPAGTKVASPDKELPIPEIKTGKAIFKGCLLEMPQGMMKEITLHSADLFTDESVVNKVPVNDDGSFNFDTEIFKPTTFQMYVGRNSFKIILAPGENLSTVINLREMSRERGRYMKEYPSQGEKIYFSGYLAGLNTELNKIPIKTSVTGDYKRIFKDIVNMSLEQCNSYYMAKYDSIMQMIDNSRASEVYKKLLRIDATSSGIVSLYMAQANHNRAYVTINNFDEKQIDEYDKTHNDFILVKKEILLSVRKLPLLNTTDILYAQQLPHTLGIISIFMQKNNSSIQEALGTNEGILVNLIAFQQAGLKLKDFTPLSEEELNKLRSYNLPAWQEIIEKKNNDLIAFVEANKKKTGYTLNETGEVNNEDLFYSLTAKYKGKAVLVDFWATWCGPCKMAMQEMKPMKEQLAGKEIVYLFIAGENSPKMTWENMIPDIHGEHVRLTNDQWSYLTKEFKIGGVPSYFLLDKEGKITWKSTGFPGVDIVKGEILKVLK
ncbi:TlpA family protein disulfide reductase [Bacteroides ihuae]|uniref:TlpA family protein disulfide reductase n=1 Tax=Bacteroides ihuae TaxID=1852362 RepID=UPI0008DAB045|nr:TlpA disulfide reductase family protein [Bacteroides ihuae]